MTAQRLSSHGIGGSEVAAACGFSRYRSRFGLWLEKTKRVPAFEGNIHTRLGQLCEPRARQLYADATRQDVVTPAASMFHPAHPWVRATPDGWWSSDPKRLVQIKCAGYFVGRRWKYEIPIEVEAQCQWEMFVTGADACDLAVLVGTDELEWERFLLGDLTDPAEVFNRAMLETFTIYRDEAGIRSLFNSAHGFWSLVLGDIQPEIDGSPEAREWLNGKRPAPIVALEYADHVEVVDELSAAVAAAASAAARLDLAKNQARETMEARGANRILTDDGPVLWTSNGQIRTPRAWKGDE